MEAYLQRLKADWAPANLSYLSYLQNQHMLHVPFENLDVIRQIPIRLDVENFYHKVVVNRRGGFCYELNGLFHSLLGKLEYHSTLIAATVHKGNDTWALENSHAAILVTLDEEYLVDVGFGDSARIPVPLTGREVEDISGIYKIVHRKEKHSCYFLQRKIGKEWMTLYRFMKDKKTLADFAPMCHFNQTSPSSPFTGKSIITIATVDGRITLSGNSLTICEKNKKTGSKIPEEKIEDTLKKYFQIVL